MLSTIRPGTAALAAAILMLTLALPVAAADVIDLDFVEPHAGDSGVARVLNTVTRVDKGLYLMTVEGDFEELYAAENQVQIDDPLIDPRNRARHCSAFRASGGDAVMMGRNWDNENVGSIIATLYRPDTGYVSISFCRAIELGFCKPIDLAEIESEEIGRRFLLAPFYSMDGVNERGLAVAVTGYPTTTVNEKDGAEPIFVSFLIRKMLDQCTTVDEAIALAENCVPFILDVNTNASQLLVVDADGASAILAYDDDQWLIVRGEGAWQALSTKPVYGVSDAQQRKNCWRHASMAGTLRAIEGVADYEATLAILEDVNQKGTTWSIAFNLTERELHFSVYQDWDTVYYLAMP